MFNFHFQRVKELKQYKKKIVFKVFMNIHSIPSMYTDRMVCILA